MDKAGIPKGFRDFLPSKMMVRQRVIRMMINEFESFGYEPLDSTCLEYAETLEGKYGEEGEKLIYKFEDRGGRSVALRYDLTIPLCRVIAMHPQIVKPFKRYHIAPVWRADKPQKGRFREFYQCDVDIVGSDSPYADAELLLITYTVLKKLGFDDFVMHINSRKILNGLAASEGISASDTAAFLRVLDKLDKIGIDSVSEELSKSGILKGGFVQELAALKENTKGSHRDRLEEMGKRLRDISSGEEGLRELTCIHESLEAYGIEESCYEFDFTLARGLDYYTGPIFETVVREPRIGSITGGGRYDNLIGIFTDRSLPATGTSFGLERIIAVMEELQGEAGEACCCQVLITNFDNTLMQHYIRMAKTLREAGIKAELYFGTEKLKRQLAYAASRGIPFVIIVGPDERNAQAATVRHMSKGIQSTVQESQVAVFIKKALQEPADQAS
jgi:histidyl-tRNA synthetase